MTLRSPRFLGRFLLAAGAATLALGVLPAGAAQPTVGLGTASSFAVLAGSQVTNTGPSVINGNLGVSPGTAITGFPPGTVNGTIHSADATAAQAQADTTTAYNDAAGRTPFTAVATELGGRTLQPGVYRNTTLGLTGTLTLDAMGDSSAVFIFQAGSTLITASGSRVALINGAQACNVFWQVGSSATLGTTTQFVGTVLALTSITANNGATVQGRLLARNGAVTLDNNTITRSVCAAQTTPTTTSTTTTSTTAPTSTTSTTAVPATSPGTTPPSAGTPSSGTDAGPSDPSAVPGGAVDGSTPAAGTGSGTGAGAAAGSLSDGSRATARTGSGAGSGSATSTGLARTGSEVTVLAVTGFVMLLLGGIVLVGAHRPPPPLRRTHELANYIRHD